MQIEASDVELKLGDCLDVLKTLDEAVVDLVYLDPPFFTQKTHRLGPRDRSRVFSFEDVWASHREYARFIGDRLAEIRRVLSPRGSLYFHCSRDSSHIVRALLDDIFGPAGFRSEIIWHYRRWSNSSSALLPAHQTIFYYSVSGEFVFNQLFDDYSPSTNVDQILQRRTRDEFGKSIYARHENGIPVSNGGKRGVPLSDTWDIPYLNPKAKERVGYPTQKPLLLLERIIRLSSNPGELVLDPFCGSGTTLVAAALLGRRALGIDVSEDAIQLASNRLRSPERTDSKLLALGRESYRTADDSILALLAGLDFVPVQRNAGIDAILKEDLDGRPILVRVQRAGETLLDAISKLRAASQGKSAGALVVVCTSRGGYFAFDEQSSDVVVVESPALQIRAAIDSLRERSSAKPERTDV
jgi:site-specific DNA-methyltransferase (adenine-specific)